MSDRGLLERAAGCYLRAGLPSEAARCLREAGAYQRAAELRFELGEFREAAEDYARGRMTELAAWTLVHHAGESRAARVLIDPTFPRDDLAADEQWVLDIYPGRPRWTPPPPRQRRIRLVLARCDIADGRPDRDALAALAEVARVLAHPAMPHDPLVEQWAVTVAEAMRRYDQAALLFAAAVRGGHAGAARRWTDWAARVLRAEITLPAIGSG